MKKMIVFLIIYLPIFLYAEQSSIPSPVKKASESIVKIIIKNSSDSPKGKIAAATGFIINPTTIITNRHVADVIDTLNSGKNQVFIYTQDNAVIPFKRVKLKSAHKSQSDDLAILEVESITIPPLVLDPLPSNSEYIPSRDLIIISDISFSGEFYLSGFPERRFQIIKGKRVTQHIADNDYTVHTGFYGKPQGISGGPLLNNQGKVVGIIYASKNGKFWVVPVTYLIELLKQPSLSVEKPANLTKGRAFSTQCEQAWIQKDEKIFLE